ncbi:MAG: hypothetical protein GVY11_02315 [Gammaproteobacteria bacterium]|jgi:hypothetical protein|nr:hypothetical protein [Gammaproteobacteria bacterium]
MFIFVAIKTAVLLVALLAFQAAAAQVAHLDYAFEAYDIDGAWIASGRLELTVLEPHENGHLPLVAGRHAGWVDPHQAIFTPRSRVMQGRIEDDRIELVPSILTHSGYISFSGRFLGHRLGAFEGRWTHRYHRDGQGYFRAWPIGETARRYGR